MHRLFLSKKQLKQDHSPANTLCANMMKFEWICDSASGQAIRLSNWRRILCYRLLGNTDKNLSLASFAQLQSPVLPVCENTGGVCSTTNLAVENLCLFSSFSHRDNVVTLWVLDIPHWMTGRDPSFFLQRLLPSSPLSSRYPKVEEHLLLQVFNPFLPRRARESDSLQVGSTCRLFIRINSSVKLGKKLLFKALGGSKHY